MKLPGTVAWTEEGGRILDQTLLPREERYIVCRTIGEVVEAIRSLRVRGAPAIGVAAAYGLALAVRGEALADRASFFAAIGRARALLAAARPTAVNLPWALARCEDRVRRETSADAPDLHAALLGEAHRIAAEDRLLCERIAETGEELVPDGGAVLTHCNAGALATAGMGTALAPLYRAWDAGKRFEVFADETRPLLQGARLTAWELGRAGIPVTLLCEGAAAGLLASGRVGAVFVGADRIAANGDAANKVGTYGLALAAAAHEVPFYVAAPFSTFDLAIPDGRSIPIELRAESEVTGGPGGPAASGARAWNPAFDVTPGRLIRAFVTDRGLLRPPFRESIARAMGGGGAPESPA
ncbi:MAG: S-methyl-5-thioribose-1-phosphate isomerase [Candidatus Latescibacterota bacterium]|nr:MAG: S-methyl-5-thioribose-1-phosphate isomerase [Candidatus Latescibacterota bacterium]